VFWSRRPAPGALIKAFQTFAAQLDSPDEIKARMAFQGLVNLALSAHAVDSHRALPSDRLRELDMLLVLVHKNPSRFDRAMATAGISAKALSGIQRDALQRPDLVQRAEMALFVIAAKQDAPNWEKLDVAPDQLLDWLSTQSPGMWHEVATGYNWDLNAPRDLGWIIEQPECDLATAMHVFLLGEPGYYDDYKLASEVPDYQRPVFDLLDRVAQRLIAGAYRTRRFSLDPADLNRWQNYQRERLEAGKFIRWVLPDEAFGPFENLPTEAPYRYGDGEIFRRRSP